MIILTGAAGFLGSNVLAGLNNIGLTDILAVDRMRNSTAAKNLAGKAFVDYVDADDFVSYDMGLPKLDAIIHFGADSSTQGTNSREIIENNYTYSKRMLTMAARSGCPFVYASSASVYGHNPTCVESPEHEAPQSPYAVSKWLFDQYARKVIASTPEANVIGLRFFNVYGPGEDHKVDMASAAYKAFQQLLINEPPRVFAGSAEIKRDFVYVRDVVFVTLHMLTNPASGIYNVGTGKAESFSTLMELASAIAGGPAPTVIPFPAAYSQTYQTYTQADLTNLRAAGYSQPFVSLEEGLRDYWSYMQKSAARSVAGRQHGALADQTPERGASEVM